MQKVIARIFLIFLIIMIPVLLITSKATFHKSHLSSVDESSLPFNNGWEYRWDNMQTGGDMSLPHVAEGGEPGTILWLSNTLPDTRFENASLFFRTSQQYMDVYMEGKLIYRYGDGLDKIQGSLPGSSWHFIRLPKPYAGKKIQIALVSPFAQYSGLVNSTHIGSESAHIASVFFQYGGILVVACLILLFASILIILYCVIKSEAGKIKSLLYLGVFAYVTGIWIASESKIIQFFVNSPVLLFYLACLSLFFMPIPLLLFIISTYKPQKSRWLAGFIGIFASFFVIVSLLQAFDHTVFIRAVLLHHILLVACIVAILYISFSEILTGNKEIRLFFAGCIVLCIFSMLDIFRFHFSSVPGLNAQGFLQFAVLAYILLLSASLGHYVQKIMNEHARNRIYESLAYTDILTGLKNRNSFEENIAKLNEALEAYAGIDIIIFDMNNLKQVNDSLGHQEGDKLIFEASKLIMEYLGRFGDVYRIGGDEFAVISTDYEEKELEESIRGFDRKLREYASQDGHSSVSLAYGRATYNKYEDRDLNPVLSRADGEMYKCKKMQKQILEHV